MVVKLVDASRVVEPRTRGSAPAALIDCASLRRARSKTVMFAATNRIARRPTVILLRPGDHVFVWNIRTTYAPSTEHPRLGPTRQNIASDRHHRNDHGKSLEVDFTGCAGPCAPGRSTYRDNIGCLGCLDDLDNDRMNSRPTIPESELAWRFGPSGGPGGQHANRAHTRAELSFDVAASAVLTEWQRERIIAAFGPVVRVSVDETRSQARNRQVAVERLGERLDSALRPTRVRRATRPGRGAMERRLQAKRQQSQRKASRRNATDD